MTHYEAAAVASCREDLRLLANDITPFSTYSTTHLEGLKASDGGWIYHKFLEQHDESLSKTGDLMVAVQKLLWSAGSKCQATMDAYKGRETENIDEIKPLWEQVGVEGQAVSPGPDPVGTPTLSAMPSGELAEPYNEMDHWIFDVMSWPDYLSVGYWVRQVLGLFWSWTYGGGEDLWEAIWEYVGGDYDKVALAADAWKSLGEGFDTMGQDVSASAKTMGQGWYDCTGATAAEGYLGNAATAISNVQTPLQSLGTIYHDVAWSSYGFFQAIFSAIDAAIDAIVAYFTGASSVVEAVAAVFDGGLTLIPSAASALLAVIESMSAAWGVVMGAVDLMIGVGGLIGAATTDVEWVTVPEG